MENPFSKSVENNPRPSKHEPTISQDPRYSSARNFKVQQPTFFNGKKVALELLAERDSLIALMEEFSLFNMQDIRQQIQKAVAERESWALDVQKLQQESERLRGILVEVNTAVEVQSFGIYDYDHIAKDSVALSRELKEIREFIKNEVSQKRAATSRDGFTFNDSEAKGRRFVADMTKLMLRAYNAEAENAVKSVKSENSMAAINKLNRCKDQAEKLGSMIELQISSSYHSARKREIELAFEHFRVLRIEKEKARYEAEQLREEKRAEAELKKKQEDLTKELYQKQIALSRLLDLQRAALDLSDADRQKRDELEAEISKIGDALKNAEERAANLQAGYVYVISNVGAFGEKTVKIGMTRRVDPMERVKELGSASVPFTFDVHLIHYSENARDIENSLHKTFADRRVNLANPRKEHFYATPAEVRDAILKLDGSITTFTEDVEARDYFESIRIRETLKSNV